MLSLSHPFPQCFVVVVGNGLSGWGIAGIVIGSLVGFFFLYQCCLKKNTSKPPSPEPENPSGDVAGEGTEDFGDVPSESIRELALTHIGDPNSSLPDVPPPAYEDIGKFTSFNMSGSGGFYPPPTAAFHLPPSQPYPPSTAPYPPVSYVTYPPPPPPLPSSSAVAYPYHSGGSRIPSAPPGLPPAS